MCNLKSGKKIGVLFLLILVLLSCLCGCQKDGKRTSTLDSSVIDQSIFEYDEQTDTTKVIWATTLKNNAIYDFREFKVVFKLYSGSELLKTESYYYSVEVSHGSEYTARFNFVESGKIDKIEYVSWTAHYDTLWQTYRIWFIVSILMLALGILVYAIFVFVSDSDISDVWDEIEEFIWLPIIFLLFGGGSFFIDGLSTYIVNICIVVGAIICFILLALLVHFLRYLLCEVCSLGETLHVSVTYRTDEEEGDEEDDEDDEEDDGADAFYKIDMDSLFKEKWNTTWEEAAKQYGASAKKQAKEKKANKDSSSPTPASKMKFSDIAGLEIAKEAFREKVILPFEHRELFEKYGKKVGGGILLYGLPGTGKTMFAEACSNELNALFIPVKCSDIKSKWYGESEDNVKKIFAKARKAERAIIFFDEFEAIGAKRTDNADNGNNDLVPQILAEMQGVGNSNSKAVIMVIAATNKPWAIDSAFLRPGRFDEKIYIPLPDFEARRKMFELKLKGTPVDQLDFDELARVSDGFNGADITEFCEKLKMEAIKETLSSGEEHKITMKDVEKIKGKIQSSVSDEDVAELFEFEKNN